MKRPIRVEGDVAFVPLTQGYEAIIDAADVPLIQRWNWQAVVQRRKDGSIRCIYANRNYRNCGALVAVRMHRQIMCAPPDVQIDHHNGSGLDNRRANLRTATNAQNAHNRKTPVNNVSGFKGVFRSSSGAKWTARICVNGKRVSLGNFKDLSEAAAAYARASKEFHGEFGRTQ